MSLLASVAIPFNILVLILIAPVFVAEKLHREHVRSNNQKRTKYLLWGVFVTNTTYQVWSIVLSMICVECAVLWAAAYSTRSLLKGTNLLFLVHRAKVAQGMDPILSMMWFEKVFPSIIILQMVGFIGATIYEAAYGQEHHCRSYPDSNTLRVCITDHSDEDSFRIAAFFVGMDFFITALLITLFAVPLLRVYQTDLGILNDNQLRQRGKVKRLLIWSIAMTFINQVTSIMAVVYMLYRSGGIRSTIMYIVWAFGQADPAFNVWTSWLMITPNREFLRSQICCCKSDGKGDLRSVRPSFAIHDPDFLRMRTEEMIASSVTDVKLESTDAT